LTCKRWDYFKFLSFFEIEARIFDPRGQEDFDTQGRTGTRLQHDLAEGTKLPWYQIAVVILFSLGYPNPVVLLESNAGSLNQINLVQVFGQRQSKRRSQPSRNSAAGCLVDR
jgi:hypothetical protein